jgi:hypothetical protein
MIETKEKEINGATYSVTQLPARRAIRLKAKLIKLFGPALAQMVLQTTAENESKSKNSLVAAIESLAASLDPAEFENLVVEVLQGSRKNGKELLPQIIDLEFAGDMESLYKLLMFILEVNYANFFTMLGIGSQLQEQINPAPQVTKKTFKKTSRES